MKVWIVFVYDELNRKFVDSIWCSLENAKERRSAIDRSMGATNFKGSTTIIDAKIEDGKLATKSSKAAA